MANIRAGNIIMQRIRPYKPVEVKKAIYTTSQDVFDRKETVLEVAKEFRSRLIKPFSADWEKGLPKYNEDGYAVLRQALASYTSYVEKLKPVDAEKFAKLAIGENQLIALEKASKNNVDVKLFTETLEKSLGRTIRSVILPD